MCYELQSLCTVLGGRGGRGGGPPGPPAGAGYYNGGGYGGPGGYPTGLNDIMFVFFISALCSGIQSFDIKQF